MRQELSYSPNFEENIATIYALMHFCHDDCEVNRIVDIYMETVYNNYMKKREMEVKHCPSYYYSSNSKFNKDFIEKLSKI